MFRHTGGTRHTPPIGGPASSSVTSVYANRWPARSNGDMRPGTGFYRFRVRETVVFSLEARAILARQTGADYRSTGIRGVIRSV